MIDQAPNFDSAWRILIGLIPLDWRPATGTIAAVFIVVWAVLNGLKLLFDVIKAWRDLQLRRARARQPQTEAQPLPPPRISIWTPPVDHPPRPRPLAAGGIPIVVTGNMKGGVGKTTLTANLAAYLDGQGKRVLLVDLDYQGSLSQTALAAANLARTGSAVDELIRGNKSMGAILQSSQALIPALKHSRILTCYYEFADTETHEMVDWLVALRQGRPIDDVRFRLANLLRDDTVQANYDIVLIDAPPRFSTGTINALCASTHLIIPTVLDQMSAEAVNYFSRDVAAMKRDLFPDLKLAGVVPTLTWRATEFSPRESETIARINATLRPHWGVNNAVLEGAFVPRKQAIGDVSGQGIGYYDAGERRQTLQVRAIFDRVGKEIEKQIWE